MSAVTFMVSTIRGPGKQVTIGYSLLSLSTNSIIAPASFATFPIIKIGYVTKSTEYHRHFSGSKT
ncbi:MAG: hypothetical protein WCK30_04815 [Actinomycetes bacterium]